MLDEERDRKINEMHQVLLGINGSPGLCKQFEGLVKSHYNLKRAFYCLVAFLVGSGVIAGTALLEFFK